MSELTVCSPNHRAASTTQRALSATSVVLATLVTQAEAALMTASPALARTLRHHDGKVTDKCSNTSTVQYGRLMHAETVFKQGFMVSRFQTAAPRF